MPDDFIRRMTQAVIESFPIDEMKKEDLLRNIMSQKKRGGTRRDVLRLLRKTNRE